MPQTELPQASSGTHRKLMHPRLSNVVLRERVFRTLDLLRDIPLLWIHSPPGAGKTVLAASYVADRNFPSIWYDVGPEDWDPATFFHYLSQTVQSSSEPLPWLAPELVGDLERFARLYFRTFYARLMPGTVLVFDNLQEVDWDRSSTLLEIACSEIPEGVRVLALSRREPPASLARLELAGRIQVVGWDAIRFNEDEALELAGAAGQPTAQLRDAVKQADGWAAGIVLVRERYAGGFTEADVELACGPADAFPVFADEVLARLSEPDRKALLQLSLLPGIAAEDAAELTENPQAGLLLERFYRARLFVDRRGAERPVYCFHALFMQFLQQQAEQQLSPEERSCVARKAAGLFEANGRLQDAMQVYQTLGDHGAIANALLRHAEWMLAKGLVSAWREWFEHLPEISRNGNPWLVYWQGISLQAADFQASQQALLKAWQQFSAAGDTVGRLAAAAALIDNHRHEWEQLHELETWAAEISRVLETLAPGELTPGIGLRAHSRRAVALLLAGRDSPHLEQSLRQSLDLLARVAAPGERLSAGVALLQCAVYLGYRDVAAQLVRDLGGQAEDAAISPQLRIQWQLWEAFHHSVCGDGRAAQKIAAAAAQLAGEFGLEQLRLACAHLEAKALIMMADHGTARRRIDEFRRALRPDRKILFAYAEQLETLWHYAMEHWPEAAVHAHQALDLGLPNGLPATHVPVFQWLIAVCHAMQGEGEAGRQWARQAVESAASVERRTYAVLFDYLQAFLAAREGDERRAADLLRPLLQDPRVRQPYLLSYTPQLFAAIADVALRHEVESNTVRLLIVENQLRSPSQDAADWPWPRAVRVLGSFQLLIGGEEQLVEGKAQRRPLDLLKILAVAGKGGVDVKRVAAQLWPDADDGKAKSALNVTFHRLRKLLGDDAAIVIRDNRARLAESQVWTDVGAFQRVADRIDTVDEAAATEVLVREAQLLLALYRGSFCESEDEPWLTAPREKMRAAFLRAVTRLGERLESRLAWVPAEGIYLRAQEAERLAEPLYRGVMRCAHARGDAAAAYSAFRRCRDNLKTTGSMLSAETEALARRLGLR